MIEQFIKILVNYEKVVKMDTPKAMIVNERLETFLVGDPKRTKYILLTLQAKSAVQRLNRKSCFV